MKKTVCTICAALLFTSAFGLFGTKGAVADEAWIDNAEDTGWYTDYTESPSYKIGSAERLASVAVLVNSGTDFDGKILEISENIDLSDYEWVPIGTPDHPFKGTIRATQQKTISGITISSASAVAHNTERYYGLIGCGLGATVTNLTISGTISVSGSPGAVNIVGSAIAYAGENNTLDCEVSRLTSAVKVNCSGAESVIAGGLVGLSEGAKISGCVNEGDIETDAVSAAVAGGLIGRVSADTLIAGNGGGGSDGGGGASSGPSRNNASLNIAADSATVGGIAGEIDGGELSMSSRETSQSSSAEEYAKFIWNMGSIRVMPSVSADVGGYIGAINGAGYCDLREAISVCDITVGEEGNTFAANVGGILGSQNTSAENVLSNCRFTTGLTVKSGTATLIEEKNRKASITVNSAGEVNTGGIYGKASKLRVTDPMVGADGETKYVPIIKSSRNVGGIGGMSDSDNVYSEGTVRITGLNILTGYEGTSAGGVYGRANGLKNLSLHADRIEIMNAESSVCAGGIAGSLSGEAADGSIRIVADIDLTSSGNDCKIGGFAGINTGTMKNISLGDRTTVRVSGGSGSIAGGFAGENMGSIDGCYSAAVLTTKTKDYDRVSGTLYKLTLGGFVGSNAGEIANSHRDMPVAAYTNKFDDVLESYIGGFAGSNSGQMKKCYAKCDVDITGIAGSPAYGGGLIGLLNGGRVENCYAAENHTVAGNAENSTVGGLIGRRQGSSAAVNSYSAVSVSSGAVRGGLFGETDTGEGVTGCVYLLDNASNINYGLTGAGYGNQSWTASNVKSLTVSELGDESNFPDWDFAQTWWISGGEGSMYSCPRLALGSGASDRGYSIRWYTENKDSDSFEISGEAELAGLAMIVNGETGILDADDFTGKTVTLTKPVSLQYTQWLPIGTSDKIFNGTFEGGGLLIDGLKVRSSDGAGLFGHSGADAELNNIVLRVRESSADKNAGTIAAVNNGTVSNARVIISTEVKAEKAGGICAQNNGTINAPQIVFDSNGAVCAKLAAGGAAGQNNGTVSDPEFSSEGETPYVIAEADNGCAGGITGINESNARISIKAVRSRRGISALGASSYAGGVAGSNKGEIANADVTIDGEIIASGASGYAGGAAGLNTGTIKDLTVTIISTVTADGTAGNAGGVAGQSSGEVSGITVKGGTVRGAENAGGAVGLLTGGGRISSFASEGTTVSADVSIGGAIGAAKAALTENTPNIQTIEVKNAAVKGMNAVNTGGIIGNAEGIMVSDITLSDITVEAETETGDGLFVGSVAGNAKNSILRDINAVNVKIEAGTSTSDVHIGGICGNMSIDAGGDKLYKLNEEEPLGAYPGITETDISGLSVTVKGADGGAGSKTAYVGGITGRLDKGRVYGSSADGSIAVSGFKVIYAGGLTGKAENAYFVDCKSSCGIDLDHAEAYRAGGFAGELKDSTARFNDVSCEKPINIDASDANVNVDHICVGGFVGSADNSSSWTISGNSAAQNSRVESQGINCNVYSGGFVGRMGDSDALTNILGCCAKGNCEVTGRAYSYVGGFVGEQHGGTVSECCASQNAVSVVSKDLCAGGFAGSVNGGALISDCYATDSDISADGTATVQSGAFAGSVHGTVTAVYAAARSASKTVSGNTENTALTFISPAQDARLDAGIHLTGFDFDSADRKWVYIENVNSDRPVLAALEGWNVRPDIDMLREQGLSQLTVSDAVQLATAAKILNDSGFVSLFTDGRSGALPDMTVNITDDIDLTGKVWEPIQLLRENDVIDGGGHTISGLKSDAAEYANYGFVCMNNGTIKNLVFTDAEIAAGTPAGIVAGTNNGTISDVSADNSTLTGTGDAGGIAGVNTGSVSGAAIGSGVTVKGQNAGGIAGTNNGEITDSVTDAEVMYREVADGTTAGGAAGANNGTMKGITSGAVVKGTTAGGIAGTNAGSITGSVSNASVTGDTAAGGVAGTNRAGGIIGAEAPQGDVVFNTTVNAPTVGGIAGTNSGTLRNCDVISPDVEILGGANASGRITGIGSYELGCRIGICALPMFTVEPVSEAMVKYLPEFIDRLNVTMTTETEGSDIYYTLDGTEPSRSSSKYAGPFALEKTADIRMFAVNPSYVDSPFTDAVPYIKRQGQCVTPTAVVEPSDADMKDYLSEFVDRVTVTMATETEGADIYYTLDGTEPTNGSTRYTEPFTVTESADIRMIAYKEDYIRSEVSEVSTYIEREGQCAMPVIEPVSTQYMDDLPEFVDSLTVRMTTRTEGAEIYYTLDGTEPTDSSTRYTEPFAVTESADIRMIAYKPNYIRSRISKPVSYFKRDGKCETPALTAATENAELTDRLPEYINTLTVAMTTETEGADIYYTLDGSEPTSSSTKYTGPFGLTQTADIRMIACKPNYINSELSDTSSYIKRDGLCEAPVITPDSQKYSKKLSVTMTTATGGAEIYYTLDGTVPTASSIKYTGPFDITKTANVRAVAVKSNYMDSEISARDYTKAVSSGGGGGGSSAPASYAVKAAETENGSIRTSVGEAAKGDKVTVTVMPDKGYELESLTAKDSLGNSIELTKNEDGTYSYIQPAGKVTLIPVFSAAEAAETDAPAPTDKPEDRGGKPDRFKDVKADAWYYSAVNAAADKGIVSGITDDTYGPEMPLTRAMFATMLYRYAGSPGSDHEFSFTDVAADTWYTAAVRWAVENGIINGYDAYTFAPEDKIKREQAAAMLYRYTEDKSYTGGALDKFPDSASISEYAKPAMSWAVGRSVINGRDNGLISPLDSITRAEIAQIFINYIDNVVKAE